MQAGCTEDIRMQTQNNKLRSEHARIFEIRKRELETRLNDAEMRKRRLDAEITSLENQRDHLVRQILATRSQLETVSRELE